MQIQRKFPFAIILCCFLILGACSSNPEFTPGAERSLIREEIRSLKSQWTSEKCPEDATPAQCSEILQRGLDHCLDKNDDPKTRCIYNELYCTLYGGDACRY